MLSVSFQFAFNSKAKLLEIDQNLTFYKQRFDKDSDRYSHKILMIANSDINHSNNQLQNGFHAGNSENKQIEMVFLTPVDTQEQYFSINNEENLDSFAGSKF